MKRKTEKQSKGWLTITILLGIMMIIPQLVWSTDISEGYHYSTNSSGHNPQIISGANFNPQIYYYSGTHNRTYYLWMQKGGTGYSIETMVFYYDHNTEELSESYGVGAGTQGATDAHAHGAIMVADDGHIIVIHEKLWNTGNSGHNSEYQVKRSILPEDPSAGFELVHTTVTGNAYPHMWKTANGDLFVSSRYGSDYFYDHYRIMLYKSTDNGLIWYAGTVIIDFGTGENYWTYHARIIQKDSEGINLCVNRCTRDPGYGYPDNYYLHSEDGETWTNIDDSYTKNTSTQGSINCMEMDNYYLIEHSDDDYDVRYITTGCFSPDGNLYLIQTDCNRTSVTNPGYWYFRYWENGEWQKIDMSYVVPDCVRPISYWEDFIYGIYSYSETTFDVYVTRTETNREIQRWQTTDRGETWTKVEDITSNSDYDHQSLASTINSDSPYIALSSSYLISTSYADLFILGRENSTVDVDEQIIPSMDTNVILNQNYPNPFNPQTTISYSLSNPSEVSLSIYNIKGELIETLVNKNQQAGDYSVVWNAENVSSGIYLYQIKTENSIETKKCVIIK